MTPLGPFKIRKRMAHLGLLFLAIIGMMVFVLLETGFEPLRVFFVPWLRLPCIASLLSIFVAAALWYAFMMPQYIVLDNDSIQFQYLVGRKRRYPYSLIRDFGVDAAFQIIRIDFQSRRHREFYYSENELAEIRQILMKNNIIDGTKKEEDKTKKEEDRDRTKMEGD